jgi:SAM-dependent methyltransferase
MNRAEDQLVMTPTRDTRHAFDANASQIWRGVLGGTRDVIRQELVFRQLTEHVSGRSLRVLDIGCGQGSQAVRLAWAGHQVTGVDPSPEMQGLFKQARDEQPAHVRDRLDLVDATGQRIADFLDPASFDLVLCQGVLAYLSESESDELLSAIRRVLVSGGLLSLLTVNGDALAMQPGLSGDWSAARDALRQPGRFTTRSGVPLRAVGREELLTWLGEHAFEEVSWYGVRVFTDRAGDTEPAQDLTDLLAVEQQAGRTDPYRRVAAFVHTVSIRK